MDMEKLVALCRRRGFIFQSSEIYGGINGFWDYGPLGVELKKNIKDAWWQDMVRNPPLGPDGQEITMVGVDCSIIMNPKVWEASGHVGGFADPMVDCKTEGCKGRFRADQLVGLTCPLKPSKAPGQTDKCQLTEARVFNLMLKTFIGAMEDSSAIAYLRPETAQGIFVNFKNVLDSTRLKLPFGIAQIGKSFRNEINPRNYIFRSREFEQMEIEFSAIPASRRNGTCIGATFARGGTQNWESNRNDSGHASNPKWKGPSIRSAPPILSTSFPLMRNRRNWKELLTARIMTSVSTPSSAARTCPISMKTAGTPGARSTRHRWAETRKRKRKPRRSSAVCRT